LTEGLHAGGAADHASPLSPDIRYEKSGLTDFQSLSTKASSEVCQAWVDISAFEVAALANF